ncbi:hypothetical protein SAMIE_1032090 [Sphingobium amiense]|uniref:Exo-alpha-sialidase n=2 Tax=Sphingobium amiense TaxID=135719 RepID=A0A494W953_9SPHN|nr:hypothetical protein SAMIE_1032090 [Sphingobium amiense]
MLAALAALLILTVIGIQRIASRTPSALTAGECATPDLGPLSQRVMLQPLMRIVRNARCALAGSIALQVPPAAAQSSGPVEGETYLWAPVAIGGGGFINGSAWDAKGVTQVARSDVHGAYRWNAQHDRWELLTTAQSMPPAYRQQAGATFGVFEIAVAPSDPHRLYMAADTRIFRSDDAGQHWTATGNNDFPGPLDANGPYRNHASSLAVAPDDPDFVAFGSPQRGLSFSRDGGARWQPATGLPPARTSGKANDTPPALILWFGRGRADRGRLWAAVPGSGVFIADPRTMRFSAVGGPRQGRQFAQGRDGSLYIIDSQAQALSIWRDGRWASPGPSAPNAPFAGIAADPFANRLYLMDEGGRAWCSTDGGRAWMGVNRTSAPGEREPAWLRIANSSYFAVGSIAFDPARKGRLWVNAGTGPYFADLKDGCGPLTLISQVRGIEETVANDAIQPPGGPPLFAMWDFGIHVKSRLDRFSSTYGPKERMIIAAQALDWSPADPRFIVTNASDTRTGCCAEDGDSVLAGYSLDGGINWSRFPALPQPPGTRADDPWRMAFGTIAVAANDTRSIVWVPAFNRSPFYTRDRGKSWQRVVLPGERGPNTGSFSAFHLARRSLAADRVLPDTFYLLHSGDAPNEALAGLWRSTDGGQTWDRRFYGEVAPGSAYAAKLRAVPGQAGHLFFTSAVHQGDARLRRSTDGGSSWQVVPGIDRADDIAFGKAASGSSYPTIFLSALKDGRYGIWRSTDNAASWQRIAAFPLGRLDRIKVMEGDKDVFGRVYLGFVGSGWVYGEPAACTPPDDRDENDCAKVRR